MGYAENIEIGRHRKVLRETFIWDLAKCVNGVYLLARNGRRMLGLKTKGVITDLRKFEMLINLPRVDIR